MPHGNIVGRVLPSHASSVPISLVSSRQNFESVVSIEPSLKNASTNNLNELLQFQWLRLCRLIMMKHLPMTNNQQAVSAAYCLSLLCKYHEKSIDEHSLAHELSGKDSELAIHDLVRIARRVGMKARAVLVTEDKLEAAPLPFIARGHNNEFFVVASVDHDRVLVQFAGQPVSTLPKAELWEQWNGEALWMTRRFNLDHALKRFGISWFIPVIVKYRRVLGEVVVASFFLQLFALVTPVCFQVVMDTVLVHRALSTLDVIAIALMVMTLFEVTLGTLRMYLFSHTSCRVDVELGSRLFEHLLKIPIRYFNARPVGQVVARVRELETIREFLTNNALTLLLDLFLAPRRLVWISACNI